ARPVRNNISASPLAFPMAQPNQTAGVRVNESAGHLSVHVEGAHPVEVAFLFEQPEKRIAPAFAGSLVSHAAFGLLALFLVRYGSTASTTAALLPEQPNVNITWLNQPGPGGGGGGGGNRMKEPPRKAELPGKDKITVPVSKAPKLEVQEIRSLDPTFGLDQQAVTAARKWRFAPGTRLGEAVSVLITIELTFTLR